MISSTPSQSLSLTTPVERSTKLVFCVPRKRRRLHFAEVAALRARHAAMETELASSEEGKDRTKTCLPRTTTQVKAWEQECRALEDRALEIAEARLSWAQEANRALNPTQLESSQQDPGSTAQQRLQLAHSAAEGAERQGPLRGRLRLRMQRTSKGGQHNDLIHSFSVSESHNPRGEMHKFRPGCYYNNTNNNIRTTLERW